MTADGRTEDGDRTKLSPIHRFINRSGTADRETIESPGLPSSAKSIPPPPSLSIGLNPLAVPAFIRPIREKPQRVPSSDKLSQISVGCMQIHHHQAYLDSLPSFSGTFFRSVPACNATGNQRVKGMLMSALSPNEDGMSTPKTGTGGRAQERLSPS